MKLVILKKINQFLILLLIILAFLILQATYNSSNIIYNSDALQYPAFYRDLFWYHFPLIDWHFGEIPHFIPFISFYSFFYKITANIFIPFFLIEIIILASIITLILGINKIIYLGYFQQTIIPTLLVLVYLLTVNYHNYILLHDITTSYNHIINVVFTLLALFLLFKFWKHESIKNCFLLFTLCFFATFSDELLISTLTVPILFSFILSRLAHYKPSFKLIMSIVLGSLLGMISLHTLKYHKSIVFSLRDTETFLNFLPTFFQNYNASLVIIWFFSYLGIIFLSIKIMFIPVGFQEAGKARASSRSGAYIKYVSSEWQQQSQNLKGDGYRTFFSYRLRSCFKKSAISNTSQETSKLFYLQSSIFSFFIFYLLTLPPCVIGSVLISNQFINIGSTRYLTAGLILPIFAMVIHFYRILSQRIKVYPVLTLNIIFTAILTINMLGMSKDIFSTKWLHNYPEETACADHFLPLYKTHFGLSEYWTSRLVMYTSNNDFWLNNINSDGTIDLRTNRYWLLQEKNDKEKMPVYSFLVLDNIFNIKSVEKIFGTPDHIKNCKTAGFNTREKILIYSKLSSINELNQNFKSLNKKFFIKYHSF